MRCYISDLNERDALLVARSAESDTHPLFWGTAASAPELSDEGLFGDEWDGSLLLSSDLVGHRCMYVGSLWGVKG